MNPEQLKSGVALEQEPVEPQPEVQVEQQQEQAPVPQTEQIPREIEAPLPQEVAQVEQVPATPEKSEALHAVEGLLSEGLGDAYAGMDVASQQAFKTAGEALAVELTGQIQSGKIKFNKVNKEIRKWLSIIPGANSRFLDQEAKIKTDEVIEYKRNNLSG